MRSRPHDRFAPASPRHRTEVLSRRRQLPKHRGVRPGWEASGREVRRGTLSGLGPGANVSVEPALESRPANRDGVLPGRSRPGYRNRRWPRPSVESGAQCGRWPSPGAHERHPSCRVFSRWQPSCLPRKRRHGASVGSGHTQGDRESQRFGGRRLQLDRVLSRWQDRRPGRRQVRAPVGHREGSGPREAARAHGHGEIRGVFPGRHRACIDRRRGHLLERCAECPPCDAHGRGVWMAPARSSLRRDSSTSWVKANPPGRCAGLAASVFRSRLARIALWCAGCWRRSWPEIGRIKCRESGPRGFESMRRLARVSLAGRSSPTQPSRAPPSASASRRGHASATSAAAPGASSSPGPSTRQRPTPSPRSPAAALR